MRPNFFGNWFSACCNEHTMPMTTEIPIPQKIRLNPTRFTANLFEAEEKGKKVKNCVEPAGNRSSRLFGLESAPQQPLERFFLRLGGY